MTAKLHGLVAATHTPFHEDGTINLSIVERQAEHLRAANVKTVFVNGSTGESHSLSVDERRLLAKRWCEITKGSDLRVVVHVGSNCLSDARAMAAHAAANGATAVAALSPSYYKPSSAEVLVDCCADIAAAAPSLPFYFYDIPALTGVNLSMREFLTEGSAKIPNLAGIKFTNPDLTSYQQCLALNDHGFDLPWGVDEFFLAALSLGASGGVGSTYNFAAPIAHRLMKSFAAGDLDTAREEQFRIVRIVDVLAEFGYLAAAKSVMATLGVDVGPVRLPNRRLTVSQTASLRQKLNESGISTWIGRAS